VHEDLAQVAVAALADIETLVDSPNEVVTSVTRRVFEVIAARTAAKNHPRG
jgi:hypothetical protein